MGDISCNLADRHHPHAHHPMNHTDDVERGPGLVVVAGAGLAFVVCIATFALGQVGVGIATAIGALLAFGAGLSWLGMDRRRVRDAERDWRFNHPAR
jgi:Na+-driven multidrug efflux pump